MTLSIAVGDRVWWHDPDDGIGSGAFTVTRLEENSEIVGLKNEAGEEVEAMSMELSTDIEVCPHCEKEGPERFTRYVGFIDQSLCQDCWESYLSDRVDDLITDFSISDILNALAGHMGSLTDNIHDSYKGGALDDGLNDLSYGTIVPVLEAPLEMAAGTLSAVAKGLEKIGY